MIKNFFLGIAISFCMSLSLFAVDHYARLAIWAALVNQRARADDMPHLESYNENPHQNQRRQAQQFQRYKTLKRNQPQQRVQYRQH